MNVFYSKWSFKTLSNSVWKKRYDFEGVEAIPAQICFLEVQFLICLFPRLFAIVDGTKVNEAHSTFDECVCCKIEL